MGAIAASVRAADTPTNANAISPQPLSHSNARCMWIALLSVLALMIRGRECLRIQRGKPCASIGSATLLLGKLDRTKNVRESVSGDTAPHQPKIRPLPPRRVLARPVRSLGSRRTERRANVMLWTIFVILLVLWALGMVSSYTLGGFIHILLVVAIAVVLIRIIQGRRPV